MKTMKSGDKIKRVSEKESMKLEKTGWDFVPKSEWKKIRPEKTEKKVSKKNKKEKNG